MSIDIRFELDKSLDENVIIVKACNYSEDIKKLITSINSQEESLRLRLDEEIYNIKVSSIMRFYSASKTVYASTSDKEYQSNKRLYELEDILPCSFIRISNTEIINLDYVSHFSISISGIINITFKDKSSTSSSRRYLKKIKEALYNEK